MELFDTRIGQRAFHSGAQRPISGNITISQDTAKAYNGSTIIVAAGTPTITISGPLPGDFGCTVTWAVGQSGSVSVAADAAIPVLLNGAGTTVVRSAASNVAGFALYANGSNSYDVSGAP